MTKVSTVFFDLDDTLYPRGNGIWSQISHRITRFMVEQVGLSPQETEEHRRRYYRSFGTSLTGLMVEYDVDPDAYLAYVHDIPLERTLAADPELHSMLAGLPHDKYVFTNASEAHARRVTGLLSVEKLFDGFIGIEALGLISKPDLRAYARALEIAGGPEPACCFFVDDRSTNLLPARQLGMRTVLVDPRSQSEAGADYRINIIQDLVAAVPELADASEESDGRLI